MRQPVHFVFSVFLLGDVHPDAAPVLRCVVQPYHRFGRERPPPQSAVDNDRHQKIAKRLCAQKRRLQRLQMQGRVYTVERFALMRSCQQRHQPQFGLVLPVVAQGFVQSA